MFISFFKSQYGTGNDRWSVEGFGCQICVSFLQTKTELVPTNEVWGKVILGPGDCLVCGRGVCCPGRGVPGPGVPCPGRGVCVETPVTATAAGGMHPTEMH